jgi:hypothetical protein
MHRQVPRVGVLYRVARWFICGLRQRRVVGAVEDNEDDEVVGPHATVATRTPAQGAAPVVSSLPGTAGSGGEAHKIGTSLLASRGLLPAPHFPTVKAQGSLRALYPLVMQESASVS